MENKIVVKIYIPSIYKKILNNPIESFHLNGNCSTRKYSENESKHLEYNLLIENNQESTNSNSFIKFINKEYIQIEFYHENRRIDSEKTHFMFIFYNDFKLLDNFFNKKLKKSQLDSFEKEINENMNKYFEYFYLNNWYSNNELNKKKN
jgi:hypothetical protein